VIFTWLIDFNSEPIAKTPKPEFRFWHRKRQPSYTYFDCSRRGQTNFIRRAGPKVCDPPAQPKFPPESLSREFLARISCFG
jgi:hypothetical protein